MRELRVDREELQAPVLLPKVPSLNTKHFYVGKSLRACGVDMREQGGLDDHKSANLFKHLAILKIPKCSTPEQSDGFWSNGSMINTFSLASGHRRETLIRKQGQFHIAHSFNTRLLCMARACNNPHPANCLTTKQYPSAASGGIPFRKCRS